MKNIGALYLCYTVIKKLGKQERCWCKQKLTTEITLHTDTVSDLP